MRYIVFIFTMLPAVLFGQTASFSADTIREQRADIQSKIMEAEWKINGQTLRYGSEPITVKIDDTIDTIFFKQYKNARWDTLICNITKPTNYTFHYNECCGAFNISDETGRFIVGSVIFIVNNSDNKHYLGTLGEAGILVKPTLIEALKPDCRSAMSPNVYFLTLSEIEICNSCPEETCLHEQEGLNYAFSYKTISRKLHCLFMPLSNQPIKVIYDAKTGRIDFESGD